jgi:hypothetical protein
MKKITSYLLIALTMASCFSTPPLRSGREGRQMPSFIMQLPDGSHVTTDSIKEGSPVVLILFRTGCSACNAETKDIIDHIASMKDTRFYFLTMDTLKDLQAFAAKYRFEKYSNVVAARDSSRFLIKYFTVPAVPYIAVFNSEKKLRCVFLGANDIGEIKESLEQ